MKNKFKLFSAITIAAAMIAAAAPISEMGVSFFENLSVNVKAEDEESGISWAPTGTALNDQEKRFFKVDENYSYTFSGDAYIANDGSGKNGQNGVNMSGKLYKYGKVIAIDTNIGTYACICKYDAGCGDVVGVVRGSGTGSSSSDYCYFYPVYYDGVGYYTVYDAGVVDVSVIEEDDIFLKGTTINNDSENQISIYFDNVAGNELKNNEKYENINEDYVCTNKYGARIDLESDVICIDDLEFETVFKYDGKSHFPVTPTETFVKDVHYKLSDVTQGKTDIGSYTTKIVGIGDREDIVDSYYYGVKTIKWQIKGELQSADTVEKLSGNYYYTYGTDSKDNDKIYIIYVYDGKPEDADYIAVMEKSENNSTEIDPNKRITSLYKNIEFPDGTKINIDTFDNGKNEGKYFTAIVLNNESKFVPNTESFEFVAKKNGQ
ncbi:MAG: hypothetical protein IJ583_07965 [Firmicutes bacterium]|nr:hypothetical protein [Bacillota bacterium]